MDTDITLWEDGAGPRMRDLIGVSHEWWPSQPEQREVAAMERGHRVWPDGMTEDYERLEFS